MLGILRPGEWLGVSSSRCADGVGLVAASSAWGAAGRGQLAAQIIKAMIAAAAVEIRRIVLRLFNAVATFIIGGLRFQGRDASYPSRRTPCGAYAIACRRVLVTCVEPQILSPRGA
jgi:hypothetical protein